ncbi:actin-binding protein WASF3 [Triplophysa rosa]|uniref:Wiskott-Aldrich syndrome protein family member n=1 Tax=Triplophysa rosa TaxID=992332 RepID=A0A9W8CAW1_TRIRA|nr:actin-binding protein WASF3 [Triplophysa rosa]KAI7813027.1 putative wiskott-Aldrich syndrome protein family member 3 [Triplophysa rosa]
MPMIKRNIEPRHLCRGALPENISNELECVNNNTLSAIIRQLSSLSTHAEDVFSELFNEANTFYLRANSLQDRIDRLAIKVTQLDSNVEEVSLQDINMCKAFKSSTVQDQQVVTKSSVPKPMAEMYNTCDRPPPLSILSAYRDDHVDGMKFYTDPSYFFDLWKEKMLQDTEHKRKERRKQREQKHCVDGTLPREVKKVRKAHNRRQEWNMMAFDKELRPDHRHHHPLHRDLSSDGVLSMEGRQHGPNIPDHPVPVCHAGARAGHANTRVEASSGANGGMEHEYHSIGGPVGVGVGPAVGYRVTHPNPQQYLSPEGGVNANITLPPVDYSLMEYYASSRPLSPPVGPIIPSPPPAGPAPLPPGPIASAARYPLPPVPHPGLVLAPPPDGPPTPPAPPVPSRPKASAEGLRPNLQPVTDVRSDLLSAIRMGIQLKKVQEQQKHQAEREPVGNDVAMILSRRIAVDYSDSEDDSDVDVNDWSD